MAAKYERGQKVIIAPIKNQQSAPKDCDIEAYAGKVGTVYDYYWISTGKGEVVYIYTVRIDNSYKDIVLYEDEIQAQ